MPTLELTDIRKTFGTTVALNGVSLRVASGSVHALLGENGAGKSTLMRIAFGLTKADSGTVAVDAVPKVFRSPGDAIASGIGMVHQHFALVPSMTVAENVVLGGSGVFSVSHASSIVEQRARETGLQLDARATVAELSVGGQQRVEILKALSRDAQILILDEPTAVLPPTEAELLLTWIREFARGACAVVLITHKVQDALRIADDITVLRHGLVVLSASRSSVTADELVHAMVQQQPAVAPRGSVSPTASVIVRLDAAGAWVGGRTRLAPTSIEIRGGELVGVAGVEGSGYQELMRIIAGKQQPTTGTRSGPNVVGFIPEDRHREAVAMDLDAVENIALSGAGRRRGLMPWSMLRQRTAHLAKTFNIRGTVGSAPVRQLSGGNQQKLVLAREMEDHPTLVVAESPTRGLDAEASASIRSRLVVARDEGAAVVVYSRDIEELVSLADRVLVVHAGHVIEASLDVGAISRALVGLSA